MDAPQTVSHRRIGTILVEKQLVTPEQLEQGLREQQQTGRPLGEICVARFGLDRLSLADALSEQWEEIQGAVPASDPSAVESRGEDDRAAVELSPEEELRILLDEAEAARAELASKTDELSRRLAALETLVVGVTSALAELRPAPAGATVSPDVGSTDPSGDPPPKRARAGRRTASPRAASARTSS